MSQQLKELLDSDPDFVPSLFSLGAIYLVVSVPVLATVLAFFLIVLPTGPPGVPSPTGCRLVGMQQGTNLEDELDAKYSKGTSDETTWKVKSLFIYPIKSCRGIELEKTDVVSTGLKYDRQFSFARLMVAPETAVKSNEPWKFITQREFPLLSQVKTQLWLPDPKRPAYREDLPYVQSGGAVVVTFPWTGKGLKARLDRLAGRITGFTPAQSFIFPFNPTAEQVQRDYTQERMTIWNETVTATNMGTHLIPELKQYLNCSQPLTLFRVAREREVFRSAPRKEQLGYQPLVGFADAFPIHIMGVASVHQASVQQPVGAATLTCRRFRANIYVAGSPPFEEDEWKRLQIGEQTYFVNCRCVRCTIPNIEPSTGKRNMAQPRKTLRETRNVDKGAPGEGCLGMNMVPEAQNGVLRVGDSLKILERGEQVYVK